MKLSGIDWDLPDDQIAIYRRRYSKVPNNSAPRLMIFKIFSHQHAY